MSRRRTTNSPPLKRTAETRRERRVVRVFTEGEGSEPDYVRGFVRSHYVNGSAVDVRVLDRHGTPKTLVDWACIEKKDPDVDEVWCIFDVESPVNHPHLHNALRKAADNGIQLAISNPCFEYWLILHLKEHTRAETTATMESESRKLDGRPKKRIDFATYASGVDDACERAIRQERNHRATGTSFPDDNPSSSMYRFVAAVRTP